MHAFTNSVIVTVAVTVAAAAAAPRVTMTTCAVTPASVPRGQPFQLTVAATATGTDVLNVRLRTPYRAGSGDIPEGFRTEPRGYAVFPDHPSGNIIDNGAADRDPRPRHMSLSVPTAGLAPGRHYLVVFAHNRPGNQPHATDWRNVELNVGEETVGVRVLDPGEATATALILTVPENAALPPGTDLECRVEQTPGTPPFPGLRAQLRTPYTVGPEEVLPGFTRDPVSKIAAFGDRADSWIADNGPGDADPAAGVIRLRANTTGWPAGVHVLTLAATADRIRMPYGGPDTHVRDVAVKIPAPTDRLTVIVGPHRRLADGTHFSGLVGLGNGQVLCDTHVSRDAGRTWLKLPRPIPRPNILSDGTVIGITYRAQPVPDTPGHYRCTMVTSTDAGRTVSEPEPAVFVVPQARAALGHGPHAGPLVGRSLAERPDGTLIAGMYGWFKGDTEPDRYRKGGTMRRAYICESADRGRTWTYLSTVAYRPFLGNEGYSELVIRELPDTTILALVRTGGNSTPTWQDNPLMSSRSSDGGRTWSPVQRTGVEGVWPDLCVLSDGTLVCSTGRPGVFLMFSHDGGRSWTDHTPVNGERYSGYSAVCELRPGHLLVGYGVRGGVDPVNGQRRNELRVVDVHLAPK